MRERKVRDLNVVMLSFVEAKRDSEKYLDMILGGGVFRFIIRKRVWTFGRRKRFGWTVVVIDVVVVIVMMEDINAMTVFSSISRVRI